MDYSEKDLLELASYCECVEVSDQFASSELNTAADALRKAASLKKESDKFRNKCTNLTKDCAKFAKENAELKAAIARVQKECKSMLKCNAVIHGSPDQEYVYKQIKNVLESVLEAIGPEERK